MMKVEECQITIQELIYRDERQIFESGATENLNMNTNSCILTLIIYPQPAVQGRK